MANRRFIDFPIATTVGDSDIILIWQSGVNKQTTKATFLSGLPENLDELNDVAISGLTNGQILRYDSVTGKWENTDQGNLDLNDLNDVSIVSPSNGQVLVYNSSTSKWENSSGGFVPYTGAVTTVNLGAQTIQAGQFVKAGGTSSQFLKADGSIDSTAYGTGSVTSVGLTMPSAFNVANSPVTTAGTLAVTGAGTVAQYIRGDGSLADFPEASGGGSSISYYLNGSVNQGTIGGVAYKELNKVPILGAGTDFTINADGYIASFLTDAGDPNLLEIPGGNWNFETYFSASSGGGSPTFYVELYKVNSGGTATLIASSSSAPELIAFGTNITAYFSSLAVPTTTLALTDRLAVRYYVTHSGRTITMHTENNHLCQIITTFTTGLTALNGLTAQVQNFATGTTGTDFNIASATATHTFNLPTASATNRGALSSADWTTFNNKQNDLGFTPVPSTRTLTINGIGLDLSVDRSWTVGDMLLNTYQVVTGTKVFGTNRLIMDSDGSAQATSLSNTQTSNSALTSHNSFGFNGSNNIYFNKGTTANGGIFAFSNSATRTYTLKDASGTLAFTSDIPANPVGGTGTTNYLPKFTGASTIGNSQIFDNGTNVGIGTASPNARLELTSNSPSSAEVQRWSYNNGNADFSLRLKQEVTSGLVTHVFDLVNNGTTYSNNLVLTNGNIGISVIPSSWASNYKAIQISSFAALTQGGNDTYLGNNWFNDGSNKYLQTSGASIYGQSNGSHFWLTAPSGTAGNAITFTQAMTLTSGGNLLVGTTTDAGIRLDVGTSGTGNNFRARRIFANGTGTDSGYTLNNTLIFQDSGGSFNITNPGNYPNVAFSINTSGNVGIGTTSPQSKLSVGGNGYSGRAITAIANNADYAVTFQQDSTSGAGLQIFTTATTWGSIPLNISDGTSTQLRITFGGNVLIGTTTDPGAKLHVNGDIRTAAPSGGSAVNWKLGTARGGTITPNAIVRVEIAGVLVDLDARYV